MRSKRSIPGMTVKPNICTTNATPNNRPPRTHTLTPLCPALLPSSRSQTLPIVTVNDMTGKLFISDRGVLQFWKRSSLMRFSHMFSAQKHPAAASSNL